MVLTIEEMEEFKRAHTELKRIVDREGYSFRSYRYKGTPLHERLLVYLLWRKWFDEEIP